MEVSQIKSVELDRTVPFKHCVLIKDATGYIMEMIMVEEAKEWEQFMVIYQAWASHPDFQGERK